MSNSSTAVSIASVSIFIVSRTVSIAVNKVSTPSTCPIIVAWLAAVAAPVAAPVAPMAAAAPLPPITGGNIELSFNQ